jgi:1-phosphofructokinase family hexose kinase
MIYTITPNPSFDLGGTIKRMVPDEKTHVSDETRFPGGNAVNAARIISRLGIPVVATGFLGGGVGDEFERLLRKEGVRHDFVRIKNDTRINVTATLKGTHHQSRLSFSGPHVLKIEQLRLLKWIQRVEAPALAVIGGSLPPGIPDSYIKRLILNAKKRGALCVLDVPGHVLKSAVSAHPLLIKPNLLEFQELVAKKVRSVCEIIAAAQPLIPKVDFICISSVDGGALLITSEAVWFGRIPRIKVMTTVGAGDSMVGAMSAILWKTKGNVPGDLLLRWGLSAAAATLVTVGTKLGSANVIREFVPRIIISRI